jgi:hypothetical protein
MSQKVFLYPPDTPQKMRERILQKINNQNSGAKNFPRVAKKLN